LTVLFLLGDRLGYAGGLARDFAACLTLGLLAPRFAQISTRWLVKASQTVAKYSYGIYLTHFFAIWLAMQEMSHLPKIYRFFVLVVLSAGLPVVFYNGIEEPMIRLGKRVADRYAASAASSEPEYVGISLSKRGASALE
jgi:peptidoglycan/LPS O-acetylase OafA/YrhL